MMNIGGLAIRPVPLLGGALLIVATFLSWLDFGVSSNGFDVPLAFLWDTGGTGDPRLGLITLILGIAAVLLALVRQVPARLATVLGGLGVVVGVLFIIQVIRAIDEIGGSTGDAFDALGIAPWFALAGGVLLLIGAFLSERR
jgi:hypothetical protein